jgi:hypothetical protein
VPGVKASLLRKVFAVEPKGNKVRSAELMTEIQMIGKDRRREIGEAKR